jgi:asparagine synthase (glutamine-hydrolysing)
MCGITGLVALNIPHPQIRSRLNASVRCLDRRGPDNEGVYFEGGIGLGHRRLSIIDTSANGNQPFSDPSGRYTIVFNGEFYNYADHRNRLSGEGIEFKSSGDTEVLLYLFIKYGERCVDLINGFFAFAIYDNIEKKLFLARDRFGIKPLYYFNDDDSFLFASEIKALIELGIPKEIDRTSLVNYLQLNYIPGPYSIFKNVKKVVPGSFLRVDLSENPLRVEERSYYKVQTQHARDPINYVDARRKLRELLRNSVHRRLVSDVPLGAFLSGGIDSSVIVALAASANKNLKTFSIGFKDEPLFDETRYAELVAEKYSTDHTVFHLSNDDLLQNLYTVLDYTDEPFADSSALAVNILSMHTSSSVSVALSGDGADELFAGYNKHRAEWMMLNRPVYTGMISLLHRLLLPFKGSRNSMTGNRIRQIHRYGESVSLSPVDRYWKLCGFVDESEVDGIIDFDYDQHEYFRRKRQKLSLLGNANSLNDFLLMDLNMVLTDDMLVKVDMNSMCHSLEVRVPFLDHEVVDFVTGLPLEYKINRQQQKRILRDEFRKDLPDELFTRPKQGFEVPLLKWFRTDLREMISSELLSDDFIESQGIFNGDGIRSLRHQLYSSHPGDSAARIWGLIVFQYWWKKYMMN